MDNNLTRLPCVIQSDSYRGRHLVASRPIREGELILQESPLITGPYGVAFSFSTCLGCYKNIQTFYRCSKCGWPVCGIECENVRFPTKKQTYYETNRSK